MDLKESIFRRKIAEAPDDDATRLIFADWLEECGGQPDRAEFIRLQVHLSNFPYRAEARNRIEDRARQLLLQHKAEWIRQDLSDNDPRINFEVVSFDRGFVGGMLISSSQLTREARHWLSHAPIRSLAVHGSLNRAELDALPDLGRLHALSWTCSGLTSEDVAALLGRASLRGLTHLRLASNDLDDEVIGVLVRDSGLRLTHLDLTGNRITSKGAYELAQSPLLTRLLGLTLTANYIGAEGAAALLRPGQKVGLTELSLAGNSITSEESSSLRRHNRLGLQFNRDLVGRVSRQRGGLPEPEVGRGA